MKKTQPEGIGRGRVHGVPAVKRHRRGADPYIPAAVVHIRQLTRQRDDHLPVIAAGLVPMPVEEVSRTVHADVIEHAHPSSCAA